MRRSHRVRASARSSGGGLPAALLLVAMLAASCGGGGELTQPGDPDGAASRGAERSADDGDGPGGDDRRSRFAASPAAVDLYDWGSTEANLVTPGPGEVQFDAVFSEDTIVVGNAAVLEAGDDHRYLLDPELLATAGARPEPGSVLLIPGTALRRVTAVRQVGEALEVLTEFASLTDAIVDGDIAWDVELPVDLRFQTDPDTTPAAEGELEQAFARWEDLAEVRLAGVGVELADGTMQEVAWEVVRSEELPLRWTYKDGPLEYLFALGVGGDHLAVLVQVKRDLGGRTALAYTAEGQVRLPRTSGSVQIRDGNLQQASIDQRGLRGSVDLSIAAAGAGKAPIDFELPGIWFRYVVPVGPIPVTIGINARVIGDIEVPAEASATATASFNFGGDMGFVVEGSVQPNVRMPDMGIDPLPADAAGWFGDYVNAEFGLAFPHMSISLFDQGVVPRIYPGMIIGSRLQWGPLCKSAYVSLVLQGSYDFKILGVNLAQGRRIDLVEPYVNTARGEGCPPE